MSGVTRALIGEASRVTRAEQRAFARQIYKLIAKTGKLEQRKLRAITDLLKSARSQLQDRIIHLPKGATFSREMSRQLKAEVERVMAVFVKRASDQLGISQEEFAKLGMDFAAQTVRSQGGQVGVMRIDPNLLDNAATRSADLIRSMSERLIGRASEIINTGVITGKTVRDVALELTDKPFDLGYSQAETIARTEMLGIHSQAEQAVLEQVAAETPGLRKQWIAVMDERTRPEHEDAHLQSVPVDEPFIVGGEELMFPRDPAGSAWNNINCRCAHSVDYSEVEDEPSERLTRGVMPPVKLADLSGEVADALHKTFGESAGESWRRWHE